MLRELSLLERAVLGVEVSRMLVDFRLSCKVWFSQWGNGCVEVSGKALESEWVVVKGEVPLSKWKGECRC